MADQGSSFTPERISSDTGATNYEPAVVTPIKHNTQSSTGSAKPIPPGTWTLNISGNCSTCHHRHEAIAIQVRASSESNHIGEIHCEHCDKLWLDFGKRNSTRISLISTETVEITPVESEYRSVLVNLIQSATAATVVASPGLAAIPESPTTSLSRETSVRSTVHSSIQRVRSTNIQVPVVVDGLSSGNNDNVPSPCSPITPQRYKDNTSSNSHHASKRSRLRTRLQLAFDRLPILHNSRLGRLLNLRQKPRTGYVEEGGPPVPLVIQDTTVPRLATITPSVSNRVYEPHEIQPRSYTNDLRVDTSVLCGPSASPAQALESLKSLNMSELKEMSSEQRTAWMRERLTSFKALQARQAPSARSATVNATTPAGFGPAELISLPPMQPLRRHTLDGLGTHLILDSDVSLYRHSLSISDTNVSDTTAVEGSIIASASPPTLQDDPQQALHTTGSPRPLSLGSIRSTVPRGQQEGRSRAQARSSWSSTTTRGIASVTLVTGRLGHRRSLQSMTLDLTLLGTDPLGLQDQPPPPTDEQEESLGNNRRSSSPPPPADQDRHTAA